MNRQQEQQQQQLEQQQEHARRFWAWDFIYGIFLGARSLKHNT